MGMMERAVRNGFLEEVMTDLYQRMRERGLCGRSSKAKRTICTKVWRLSSAQKTQCLLGQRSNEVSEADGSQWGCCDHTCGPRRKLLSLRWQWENRNWRRKMIWFIVQSSESKGWSLICPLPMPVAILQRLGHVSCVNLTVRQVNWSFPLGEADSGPG